MSQSGPNDAKEVFDLLDRRSEGVLKTEQLGTALRSVGVRVTDKQITELKEKADKEFGGTLDFEAFKDYICEGKKIQKTDAELAAAFKVFDNGDQNGLIDIESFRHALSTLGDKMSPEEIDDIIQEARKMYGEDEDPRTISADKLLRLIQSIS